MMSCNKGGGFRGRTVLRRKPICCSMLEQSPISVREQVLPGDSAEGAAVSPLSLAGSSSGTPAGSGGPVAFVHTCLRGRYTLVIVLGLLMGAGVAVMLWQQIRPTFQSEALIQIAYALPSADGSDAGRTLPMFNTFMASQKTLITSRRAIDSAVQDPVWKAYGRQVPEKPDWYFARNLTVEIKPGSEFIRIVVADVEPATAAAAVNSILNAYTELFKGQEDRWGTAQRGVMEDAERTLQAKIKSIKDQIQAASADFGGPNIEIFYEAAAARVNKLDAALFDVRIALAGAAAADPASTQAAPATQGVPTTQPADHNRLVDLTLDQVAALDPATRRQLDFAQQLEADLDEYSARGLGESHAQVKSKQELLKRVYARAERQADMYRQFSSLVGPAHSDQKGGFAGQRPQVLMATQASLHTLHKAATEEMLKLGSKRSELQRLELDLEAARKELDRTELGLKTLQKSRGVGSRLTVISTGEIPLSPSRDRRLVLSAAGGLGGFVLPALLFVGVGLIGGRYRYSDETEAYAAAINVPLLGILPELRSKSSDRSEMLAAAYGIHHMRVSLMARMRASGWRSFLLTSAAAAEGKTSLTVSLGLSLAASHLKTLLIDADLIGRHLTDCLGARGRAGLHEALAGSDLDSLVCGSALHTNLFVLPAGNGSNDACSMSAEALAMLIKRARDLYDVVLVDSGPILGSIEASVVAPEVDGVIFTLAQGQNRRLVEQAMRRVGSLGARVAGIVFNRARSADFQKSSVGSSTRTMSLASPDHQGASAPLHRNGPLVHAASATLPTGETISNS